MQVLVLRLPLLVVLRACSPWQDRISMTSLTRFSVKPLSTMTRTLADVASTRREPDLVIQGARALPPSPERIIGDREVWISGGRIAAVKSSGSYRGGGARLYDAKG